jgi:hypothetical protein
MPQSKIRSLQLNSSDFKEIVETALGAPLNIVTPLSAGTALTLSGSPVQWTPVSGGGTGITGGDGITVTGGSPTTNPFIVAVDGTVARTDITTETFSFAGDVSLNLNDTSQAADEDIWRIGATGSSFVVATRTDADGAGISAISITRTGTAVDDITMPSPLLLTSSGEASTSVALQVQSSNPTLAFNKTDATANQGVWDVTAGTDGQLIWRTRTDAFGTGATWLTVNRTGTTVGTIALAGTSLTFNGQVVQVGSPYPAGGGSGTVTSVDLTAGTLIDVSGGPITTSGSITVDVDLSEATEAVYAPATDYLLFLDGGITGTAAKESGADFAAALAGTGLTASSGVINRDTVALTTDTSGDYVATITGGTGIDSTGATTGEGTTHTLSVDLGEVTAVVFDPANDYLPIIDGGATGTTQKDAWTDIATAIAGSGITATAGVLSVSGSVTATTGADNRIAVFTTASNIEGDASFQWDASTATLSMFDTTDTDSVTFQHDGTDSITKFTNTRYWWIQPSDTGPLWITRRIGSPLYDNVHSNNTNPTIRIGQGSPTTTTYDATVAIHDPFGPGLTLKNTFNNVEFAVECSSGIQILTATSNFVYWYVSDTAGNSYALWNTLPNDVDVGAPGPVIQFQESQLGDIRLHTQTNNSVGTGTYSISNGDAMVSWMAPTAANVDIRGVNASTIADLGKWHTFINCAAGPGSPNITDTITFKHEDTGATAAARMLLPGSGDIVLRANDSIQLVYDTGIQRWRCMATTGVQQSGSPIT